MGFNGYTKQYHQQNSQQTINNKMSGIGTIDDTLDDTETFRATESGPIIDCFICHEKQQSTEDDRHSITHSTIQPFYLTSCSHVLCATHAHECAQTRHPKCSYCSASNINVIEIDKKSMPPDIYRVFENVDDQLGNLYGIMQFQSNIVKGRIKHLEQINMQLYKKCERQRELLVQARDELAACKGLKQRVENLEKELGQRGRNGVQESKVRHKTMAEKSNGRDATKLQDSNSLQSSMATNKPVKQYEYNKANHTFNKVNVLPVSSFNESSFVNTENGRNNAVAESTAIYGKEYRVNQNRFADNAGKRHVLDRLGINLLSRDVVTQDIRDTKRSSGQWNIKGSTLSVAKPPQRSIYSGNSNNNNNNGGPGIFQNMKCSNTNTSHSKILSSNSNYAITKPNFNEQRINTNLIQGSEIQKRRNTMMYNTPVSINNDKTIRGSTREFLHNYSFKQQYANAANTAGSIMNNSTNNFKNRYDTNKQAHRHEFSRQSKFTRMR
ncbi:hypothetical protein ACO0QE_001893 [Hanseniaspora vineae]